MSASEMTVLSGFRRVFHFVPERRRGQGLIVLGLMLLGALAELLTIGAVLPFLAVIADPTAAEAHPLLHTLLTLLGLHDRATAIVGIAALFCFIAVAAAAVRILLAWASQRYVFRLGYDLGVAMYRRILYQPYSFHVSHNSSQIISGINKVQQLLSGMLLPMMQAMTSIIIAAAILGGLLLIDAPVALAAAGCFSLIYVGVSLATRKKLRGNSEIISRTNTLRLKTVQEGLGGIRDVLIDQAQPVYIAKFAAIDTELRDAQATNAMIGATPRFVIEGLGIVMIALIALVLGKERGGLANALPVLGALALGAQRLLPLLQQVYNGWTQIAGNRATFFDVLDLLDRPLPADVATRRHVAPMPFTREIALDHVSFRYTREAPAVARDIDLRIAKGSRVGFVGRTGSGKSTVMDLVMGLLEPTSGTIRIDDAPLDASNIASWQVQVAHVPQHIYLADGTILENIAFGVPLGRIDEERAREAATRADIASFIDEQPDGYHAIVGERGVRLSGGQRQRIGIARALYKRSTVLIFDEATSALDDATETSVMQAIDGLGRDLTVLMIAHRITTLRNCDVIYRLDRGAIIQSGGYATIAGLKGAPSLAH